MQKRSDIQTRGFAPIFNEEAMRFVLRWHKPMSVHASWLRSIEGYAGRPDYLRHGLQVNFALHFADSPDLFAALLNFLRQKWAALDKSKAGKLKKFLSQNTAVNLSQNTAVKSKSGPSVADTAAIKKANDYWKKRFPKGLVGAAAATNEDVKFLTENAVKWKPGDKAACDSMGNYCIWHLQDGELATAFEHSPGGQVVTIEDVRQARKWVVAAQKAGKKFAEKVLDEGGFIHVKGTARRK